MRAFAVLLLTGCAVQTTESQSLEEVFARVQSAVVTVKTESRRVDPERDAWETLDAFGRNPATSIGIGKAIFDGAPVAD